MTGFYLAIGKQGSGKTAIVTKFIIDNAFKDGVQVKKVFSNYTLYDIDFTPTTFDNEKEVTKGKLDVLKQLEEDPNFFNNSIMAFDEIQIYFDSRDFMNKNHRIMQAFFSQLRKRNILMFGTTQYILNFDVRLRRQCMNVFLMQHIGKHNIYEGDIFVVETHDIDGYNTQFISSYLIDLSHYFPYYNTHELID